MKRKKSAIMNHFDIDNMVVTTMLCRGAMVSLTGKNLLPEKGLFNGATGKVQEIVYQDNQSPNDGHLPLYVAVDFPTYNGQAWDPEHPMVRKIYIIVTTLLFHPQILNTN